MYIFLGLLLVGMITTLAAAAKFAPYSEMMNSFEPGGLKKLLLGLSAAAIAFLSYGIYFEVTYQPPFLDIMVEGKSYTVFGDIGNKGYYANELIRKNEETEVHLVSWESMQLAQSEVLIAYPSGKEVVWEPAFKEIKSDSYAAAKRNRGIKEIYRSSPYLFEETGKVKLHIEGSKRKKNTFTIEVRE
ncbi:hypothetical protein [Jeotgalibacillus campisalis]|uniref:Uncharacterized protein n=1 Tax=Jeotgalibacillus campisalis TaxID=220754 RepID=A0A0C2VW20_9BACL|nr:hypothetical protein [Jeotgalibacillus campisalis]KIL53072.1 hypothetical protein KR50_04010 [Jeotgalibacillus campisalis]